MKSAKVEFYKSPGLGKTIGSELRAFSMLHPAPDWSDAEFIQISTPTLCRESLIRHIESGLKDQWVELYDDNNKPVKGKALFKDETLLFIQSKEVTGMKRANYLSTMRRLKGNAMKSLELMRHFEKLAGWKQRTEVRSVRWKGLVPWVIYRPDRTHNKNLVKRAVQGFLFIGPKEWQENPQLMSIFSLLARIGKYITVDKIKNNDQILKITDGKKSYDLRTLRRVAEVAPVLMKNLEKIFGRGGPQCFRYGSRGIVDFLDGKGDKKALEKMNELHCAYYLSANSRRHK